MWRTAVVLASLLLLAEFKSIGTSSAPWEYVGCYKDRRPRDLTSYHKDESESTPMTLERCYKFCSSYNNQYMALQEGKECRCDNGYGRYGATSEDNCDDVCTGNKRQQCGGTWANAVYKIRESPATKITSAMMTLKTSRKLAFTALGDWGLEGSPQRDVAKQLGQWSQLHDSAFTAAIGDNFYETGVYSPTDSKFRTTWRNVYTHTSLQRPWLVIEGNHDYLRGNAPNQVMYGKTDKRWVMPSLYYSMHYDVGGQDVHFIFLDTDPIRNDNEYHQYNWFKQEISNSKSEWIIVIGHHPVFSSGSHGSESSTATMYDNIRSEMLKYKAALYVCGHDHFMEHMVDPRGVVDYIISGSAAKHRTYKSSSAEKNLKKKKVPVKFWNPDYGFAGIEIEGNTLTVTFIDRDGDEKYSFSKRNPRVNGDGVIG